MSLPAVILMPTSASPERAISKTARGGSASRGQGPPAPLEQGTSQADAAGLPCYLETGTEENVAFYSKLGFAVTGQAEIQSFTLSGMVRPPRSSTPPVATPKA